MNSNFYKIITPKGNGGIATIVVLGEEAEKKLSKLFISFNKKKSLPGIGIFKYGQIVDKNDNPLDEVLLAKINDNQFEIHSHGGIFSLNKITKELEINNFNLLNEESNINIERDYLEIISSISNIRDFQFIENQIKIYHQLFEDTNKYSINQKQTLLQTMLGRWKFESHQRRRAKVCLAGLPNAGKSSLINRITGKKRALVSQQEKTTRDTITENFQTKGYLFQLIDTAGIHNPDNELDKKSVELTYENIKKSEMVIWLHSIEDNFQEDEIHFINKIKKIISNQTPFCLVLTKNDLQKEIPSTEIRFQKIIQISSNSGDGIDALLNYMVSKLFDTNDKSESPSALSNNMAQEIEQLIQDVDFKGADHRMIEAYFEQLNKLSKLMIRKEN